MEGAWRDGQFVLFSTVEFQRDVAIRLNARYRDLLKQIAYPRRGTEEDRMDIFDAAKLIQDNFTAEELGCDT